MSDTQSDATPETPAFNDRLHVFESTKFRSVVEDAVQFFVNTPIHPLPPTYRFIGPGVYGLYYTGGFGPYSPIATANGAGFVEPIYVGKAVAPGWRTGRNNASDTADLHNRLGQHAASIRVAENLDIKDFICRFMIIRGAESDLIGPVEAELIRRFLPLWNVGIDGFGNHAPGSGRYNQARSHWDVLHPGRNWAAGLTGTPLPLDEVLALVRQFLSAKGLDVR